MPRKHRQIVGGQNMSRQWEEHVEMNNPQDYADWLAEYGEQEVDEEE